MALVEQRFSVVGMSCASCAASISEALKKAKGVDKVQVNYANHAATIAYHEELIEPRQLKEVVQSIGYDLVVDSLPDEKEARQQQYIDSLKKNWVYAAILGLPVVLIGMFAMDWQAGRWLSMILSGIVLGVFGRQFFVRAFRQLLHRQASMDTLVALSTGIAFLFSSFNTLFPQVWHAQNLYAHVYFEASVVIVVFILLGKFLEEKAKKSTSSALKKLMQLQEKSVRVVENGAEVMRPVETLKVGDVVVVRAGEKIPTDGVVIDGSSFVDESMLTGEAAHIEKKPGSSVFAGTLNQEGSFRMKAEKVGADTMLAQIIKAVEKAQASKAPIERLTDKVAAVFVPIVIAIALITWLAWTLFGGEQGGQIGILTAVTVLVIACPCALGLATPTAIIVGIGKAAENHILIKNAESLELACKVNTIVLDKTGTITEGKPSVVEIHWAESSPKPLHAHIWYSLEALSQHPLSKALVNYFEQQNARQVILHDFESVAGKGLTAKFGKETYWVGSEAWMTSLGISMDENIASKVLRWNNPEQITEEASTLVFFANSQRVLAFARIEDVIRKDSAKAISRLKQRGITVYMLTGDSYAVAKKVAERLEIEYWKANCSPFDKAEKIRQLKQQGNVVAMVGDGINDAEALAEADVSIAMGKGTDIAIEVAQITLLSSKLEKIEQAIVLSRQTVACIRQNLFWAFIYNLIGIPIAAGAFYAFGGFLLNPMLAGAAMAFSSISVVLNSLRLRQQPLSS